MSFDIVFQLVVMYYLIEWLNNFLFRTFYLEGCCVLHGVPLASHWFDPRSHGASQYVCLGKKGSINLGLDFAHWVKNKHYFIFDKNIKILLATAYLNNLSQYE